MLECCMKGKGKESELSLFSVLTIKNHHIFMCTVFLYFSITHDIFSSIKENGDIAVGHKGERFFLAFSGLSLEISVIVHTPLSWASPYLCH